MDAQACKCNWEWLCAKILWDFNIFAYHVISARQPDIVIVDKVSFVITMIDVSIPADKHLTAEEEEKLTK